MENAKIQCLISLFIKMEEVVIKIATDILPKVVNDMFSLMNRYVTEIVVLESDRF